MSAYLFAYGTLQPGLAPADVAPLVEKLKPIGEGAVRGLLYDLGGHPGAIIDPSTDQKIKGLVLELPKDEDLLPALDAYEEFDPATPERSPFLRILRPVELASGGTLDCWVYIWNGNPASAPIIPCGRFR
jgi:gamma-glutamylcyclotransferase (GGCT)/AIG2-like uncharacterized protein YtfP